MDKNIIKNHLSKRFISEETTPGISVTDKVKKESDKINKAGVAAVAKDVSAYDKSLKKEDPDMGKMAKNKYNYTNDSEKTYHEEMEILNGQEMIKYDREPGAEFSQRAKEGIEGSSRMGNKGGKDIGNAEETWGASKDSFGKDLVKRIKDSERKRNIADAPIDSLTSLGDKIAYPNDKVSVNPDKTAMSGKGKNNSGDNTPKTKSATPPDKNKIKVVKENRYPVYLKRSLKEAPVATPVAPVDDKSGLDAAKAAPVAAKAGLVGAKAAQVAAKAAPTDKKSSGATSGNSDVRSPTSTSTEVRSPTSTEVRSPTSTETSTDAYTSGNITVTGGAGAGDTEVHIHMPTPEYERLPSGQGRKEHMPSAVAQPGPNDTKSDKAITQSGPNDSKSDKSKLTESISERNVQVLTNWVQKMGAQKAAEKLINSLSQTGMISDLPDSMEYGQGLNRVGALLSKQNFDMAYKSAKALASKLEKIAMRDMMGETTDPVEKPEPAPQNDGEDYEKSSREVEYGINPHSGMNENNNKPKIKESMKRITFKKEFEGSNTTQKIGHALTLIPEGYRTDKKEFEITDGNVTCKIRWEGTLSEGKAIVLTSANKALISEDMTRMKQLMGYKSQDTLGLVKGNARIDENKAFGDIWNKTKKLLGESEDIEDADAAEGDADDAVGVAKEAKKDINGSVSTEKGTQAPAPKTGDMASLDKVVKHAAEAKKHVEGSVATEKKTEAPAPKVGNWEEIKKAQASEAKKDIETGTPTHKATDTAKVVKENIGGEDDIEGEESAKAREKAQADNELSNLDKKEKEFYSSDDDDSSTDAEPSANDIKSEVPPVGGDEDDAMPAAPAPTGGIRKMKNPDTGEIFLTINGKHAIKDDNNQPVAVPQHLFDTYGKDYDEVIAAMERGEGDDEGLDEYGDEHQVSTADAVSNMGQKGVEEGMFGGGNELRDAKSAEFDQVNAKLAGTKGDQTANKEKWLARAKNDDNFKGNFMIDRGILQYKSKSAMPATGGSSGMGTANEVKK